MCHVPSNHIQTLNQIPYIQPSIISSLFLSSTKFHKKKVSKTVEDPSSTLVQMDLVPIVYILIKWNDLKVYLVLYLLGSSNMTHLFAFVVEDMNDDSEVMDIY